MVPTWRSVTISSRYRLVVSILMSASFRSLAMSAILDHAPFRRETLLPGPAHGRRPARLGSVPLPVIDSFFVDHYVAGLTAGSVKNSSALRFGNCTTRGRWDVQWVELSRRR